MQQLAIDSVELALQKVHLLVVAMVRLCINMFVVYCTRTKDIILPVGVSVGAREGALVGAADGYFKSHSMVKLVIISQSFSFAILNSN